MSTESGSNFTSKFLSTNECRDILEENIRCPICTDIFRSPTEIPCCNKTFCFHCLSQCYENNATCPTCRSNFDMSQCRANKFCNSLLSKLNVDCLNKQRGCKRKYRFDEHEDHKSICEYELIPCKWNPKECNILPRTEQKIHEDTLCENRRIKCIYGCQSLVKYNNMEIHKDICDLVKITCEECNNEYTRRDLMYLHICSFPINYVSIPLENWKHIHSSDSVFSNNSISFDLKFCNLDWTLKVEQRTNDYLKSKFTLTLNPDASFGMPNWKFIVHLMFVFKIGSKKFKHRMPYTRFHNRYLSLELLPYYELQSIDDKYENDLNLTIYYKEYRRQNIKK